MISPPWHNCDLPGKGCQVAIVWLFLSRGTIPPSQAHILAEFFQALNAQDIFRRVALGTIFLRNKFADLSGPCLGAVYARYMEFAQKFCVLELIEHADTDFGEYEYTAHPQCAGAGKAI